AVLTAFRWGPTFSEHFFTGIVDLPQGPPDLVRGALRDLAGTDVAVATFEGPESQLRRHGWRSAATLVAALTATSRYPSDPLVGRSCVLRQGRQEDDLRRANDLGRPDPIVALPE